jgi:hypothetical protein
VNDHDTHHQAERQGRIEERLGAAQGWTFVPVVAGSGARYEVGDRVTVLAPGGIGLVHQLVRSIGLAESIDGHLSLFKRHFPYHESDHVLNLAYNVMAGGTCLEDLERLRQDEAYLDTLGAARIPDPTTAGDFLRRFEVKHVLALQEALSETQRRVWKQWPRRERRLALVDVDGTVAPTEGECKQGMDLSYKGEWGYAPLLVSLANTGEVLFAANRPGNAPSHQGAAAWMDAAVTQVREGGFRRVRLRGDTDFSLTEHFDRWTRDGVEFVFGMDAHPSFVARAQGIPESSWRRLQRPLPPPPRTGPRAHAENVKARIVRERGYKNLVTEQEDWAELEYRPVRARAERTYRLVILRKRIRVEKGQLRLEDEIRYFFYVTNVPRRELVGEAVIFEANARCNQENVIEQLKNGVAAMRMPSDTLLSNWAYLVIASLAWNLKAWLSIVLPHRLRRREIRRMEFRRFLRSLMWVPCQVVKAARGLRLRIATYTPWADVLVEGTEFLRRRPLVT